MITNLLIAWCAVLTVCVIMLLFAVSSLVGRIERLYSYLLRTANVSAKIIDALAQHVAMEYKNGRFVQ